MKIAVITPTHGTPAAWLEQCLLSVARQTVPAAHFLVCDGDDSCLLALFDAARLSGLPVFLREAGAQFACLYRGKPAADLASPA